MSPQRSSFNRPFARAALAAGCALLLLGARSGIQSSSSPQPSHQPGSQPVSKGVSASRGRALFTGGEPLIGRLRDQRDAMPPEVVTCNHCHATTPQKPAAGSDAPVLDAAGLTQFKIRRNSPQSRYDKTSFCKLMRTNIDPVYVLVAKQMPVYAIDDEQCDSLWVYLTAQPDPPSGR